MKAPDIDLSGVAIGFQFGEGNKQSTYVIMQYMIPQANPIQSYRMVRLCTFVDLAENVH